MRKFFTFALMAMGLQAFALTDGATYSISLGDKALFLENATMKANGKVVAWTDTKVPAQRWILENKGENGYALRNAFTGYYLGYGGTSANAAVDQRTYSVLRSCWNLVESAPGSGKYYIVPTKSEGNCISLKATDNGSAAVLGDRASASNCLFELLEETSPMPTEFNVNVRDNMMEGFLGQYYHEAETGHVFGKGGWWGDAEMFETVLDAFATTGDLRYKTMFDELYIDFTRRNGTDWSNNQFNDDITWMTLACLRAYKYFGNQTYLTVAKENYTRMYNRALQPYGTLIWKNDQENKLGTNSCINCPATIAACYLGELTGDKSWYDKAKKIYAGQRDLLYNPETGEVWDSRAWTEGGGKEKDFNHWVSTYNQGTMLGAAIALYVYTGEEQYKEDADKVYARTLSALTNSDKIIHVCQTINGDLCGFKGILMRYVRTYGETFHKEEALDWIGKNAWFAWQNRNPDGVIWSAWLTKTADDLKRREGDDDKDIKDDAFGSSTAVSAAFNAHVNRQFAKEAAKTIGAEAFDDIQFMQIADAAEDGDTPVTTPSALTDAYLCFRNVDFGAEGLDKAILRLNATAARSFAKIYVDGLGEENLLGRNSGFIPRQWSEVSVDLGKKITGVHDVYVVFNGTGVQFHNLRFEADPAGVAAVGADESVSLRAEGSKLVVKNDIPGTLSVCSMPGISELTAYIEPGEHRYGLEAGAHICSFSSERGNKVVKIITKGI